MQDHSYLLKALQFLKKHLDVSKPVLLGFSGGSDSTVLFDFLMGVHREFPLDLHVLHVDHKWRKASTLEASILKNNCQEFPVTFHLREIEGIQVNEGSNLEEKFREKRYEIFQEIYHQIGAQALLLAHHQDDLVETILKRILEGASPENIGGMSSVDSTYQMKILRPFLSLSKEEIWSYIEEHQLGYIHDETNEDLKYLRPRMRQKIIPLLEANFGKSIQSSLVRMANDANSLKEYLHEKTLKYMRCFQQTSFGGVLCFDDQDDFHLDDIHPVELKFILKKILKTFDQVLSSEWIEGLTNLITLGKANKRMHVKDLHVEVDRRRVFFFHKVSISGSFIYSEKRIQLGDICLNLTNNGEFDEFCHIVTLLTEGRGMIQLPTQPFSFKNFQELNPEQKRTLKKKLQMYKIPQFLWGLLPIISMEDGKLLYPWVKESFGTSRKVLCTIEKVSVHSKNNPDKNSRELKDKFSRLC